MWSGFIKQCDVPSAHRSFRFRSGEARLNLWRAHSQCSEQRCPPAPATGRRSSGFTLIELLIAVAIVAILASIALPSYSQYVIRANRTQAKQFMEDIANREEQYLLDQRSYAATIGVSGLGMVPPSETSGLYTFAVAAGGNDCLGGALPTPGYTIIASAIGTQTSDGDLCLDSVNHKTPTAKWER
jgi:type IV pilus assembly protein PilE